MTHSNAAEQKDRQEGGLKRAVEGAVREFMETLD